MADNKAYWDDFYGSVGIKPADPETDWTSFYSSVGISSGPVGLPPATRTVKTIPVTKAKTTPVSYSQYFDPDRLANQSIGQLGVDSGHDAAYWSDFYSATRPWYLPPLQPVGGSPALPSAPGVQLPRPRPWDAPTSMDLAAIAAYERRGGSPIAGASYTVQAGDTLSEIAARAGRSVKDLMALNGITDPNKIVAGKALQLSGEPKQSLVSKVVNGVKSVFASDGQASYVIKSGDTLSAISKATGISVSQLASMNGITDPNKIVAGKSLVLNTGKSSSSSGSGSGSGSGSNSVAQSPKAVLKSNGDGTFTTSSSKQTVSVGQKVSTPSGVKTVQANGTLK